MTENMAGRGEGLAGLVAERDRINVMLAEFSAKGRDCYDSMPYVVGKRDGINCAIAALEAAAPAGTARRSKLELSIAEECLKPAIDLLNDAIWNYRETVTIKRGDLNYAVELAREALATPSAQAPANNVLCPENEQDATTAGESGIRPAGRFFSADNYDRNSPLVQAIERGYEKWLAAGCHESGCGCVTVYIHKELSGIAPAATQEPAGSGASNLSMCGVPMEIMGCFICQGEVKNWCPTHGNGAAAPGSPRKVGEDGALTQERARMIAACLIRDCTAGWKRTRESVIEEIASTLLKVAARSSSVPVGEQKQEEGV